MKKSKVSTCMGILGSIVLVLCLAWACPACAEQVQPTQEQGTSQAAGQPIYNAEQLLGMANNPNGSYSLMCDIDMTGVAWQPIEFHGTLDGNGHAILNASVTSVTSQTRKSYDGNLVAYDTVFSGFFGILENATIRNVAFYGLNVDVSSSAPTFVGGVCGYMDSSIIDQCTVEGQVALATTGPCFGVGGAAGFGNGQISNCVIDVTLVCRDQDVEQKDEQFMGGIYADGYIDIIGNDVTIRGYDSDHGYVHDGGLAGMYILYPEENGYAGTITNNNVKGFITFFEDNADRRAYCDPEIGENMSPSNITRGGNTNDFTPDEKFEYDTDLLPHSCANPQWSDQVQPGNCSSYGWTERTCTTCGYTYRTAWTPAVHDVKEWVSDGTDSQSGMVAQHGSCAQCGAVLNRLASAQEADSKDGSGEAAQQSSASEQATSANQARKKGFFDFFNPIAIGIVAGVVLAAIVIALIHFR